MLITGASAGIGKETAAQLARQNAHLVLACRDAEKTAGVIAELRNSLPEGARIEFMQCDLNDLASVQRFAHEFRQRFARLDVLIANAGVYNFRSALSAQGLEQNFGVNHLGHFLLAQLLLDRLRATQRSRVVVLSSRAHSRVSDERFRQNAHRLHEADAFAALE